MSEVWTQYATIIVLSILLGSGFAGGITFENENINGVGGITFEKTQVEKCWWHY